MKVLVLRGIPGSGKSTLAQGLRKELEGTHNVVILSADDYFMKDGEYVFVPQLLSEAHGTCFRLFLNALMPDDLLPDIYAKTLLIVDNTNITAMEASPYMLAAQAAGVPAAIYSRWANPTDAMKYNVHKVPEELIFRMAIHCINEHLPGWWRKLHDLKAIRDYISEGVA